MHPLGANDKIYLFFTNITKNTIVTNQYSNSGIGFSIKVTKQLLEECIKENSNRPYWKKTESRDDLRAPSNQKIRKEILKQFQSGE